jgi:hypothetical protein
VVSRKVNSGKQTWPNCFFTLTAKLLTIRARGSWFTNDNRRDNVVISNPTPLCLIKKIIYSNQIGCCRRCCCSLCFRLPSSLFIYKLSLGLTLSPFSLKTRETRKPK